ncbi:hypothetical protein [Bdellovibrio sp. HCB288]|uniref:hypothetical protein n=1 Tax=Bdellovibrio sp. HCB288 TaxID=3394355 RepID=UPI0039B416EB
MPFIKGMPRPPNAGRKKGSPNKRTTMKVLEVLTEREVNPTEKILDLIPLLDPQDQLRAWCFLISYSQAKPNEIEAPKGAVDDGVIEQMKDVSDANLIKLATYRPQKDEDDE